MGEAAVEANKKKKKKPTSLNVDILSKMDSYTKLTGKKYLLILCWHSGGADNLM